MAAPISNAIVTDMGGNVVCGKYFKTGYNNPGVLNLTGTQLGAAATNQTANIGTALTVTNDNHLGLTLVFNAATGTVTLPAATGTGFQYTIFSGITATSQVVTVPAGTLYGVVSIAATTSGTFVANGNASITMNGTTHGGILGTTLYYTDMATGVWVVEGNLVGSGTSTTPVS